VVQADKSFSDSELYGLGVLAVVPAQTDKTLQEILKRATAVDSKNLVSLIEIWADFPLALLVFRYCIVGEARPWRYFCY
jgi:hypothetical protein